MPEHRSRTGLDPEAAAQVINHRDYFVQGWPSSAAQTPTLLKEVVRVGRHVEWER